MIFFKKETSVVYNNIATQNKTSPNSLTVAEWNRVINVLSRQTNNNTEYLVELNKFLFGEETGGYFEYDIQDGQGMIHYLYNRAALLDDNGLIRLEQVPGSILIVEQVTVLPEISAGDRNKIYIIKDGEEIRQYRFYGEGYIELAKLEPFENLTIDCGTY